MNLDQHIQEVIRSHKITHERGLLDKYQTKRNEVVSYLQKEYRSKLYSPFNSGSYAKNTAINVKFDFDVVFPFKRDAFKTLKEMHDEVYEKLVNEYSHIATVTEQKVSIGIEFQKDNNGDIVKIDVVPGRELNQDTYDENQDINLYVNNIYGQFSKGSDRIKSNVAKQIENIKNHSEKSEVRKAIRLLKVWKHYNRKDIKSFFIELIVLKAFEGIASYDGEWDMLKLVLEYVRDNIKSVRLIDPGNENNNISDTMTDIQKSAISFDLKNLLESIERNESYISTYFPINSKFKQEKENPYGLKENLISSPPPLRFG